MALTHTLASTGRSIKVTGKKVANAVYPEVKRKGLNAEHIRALYLKVVLVP